MLNKLAFTFTIAFSACISLYAQEQVTTFGLQFKPIISSEFINTGPQFNQEGTVGFEIAPNGGFNFGMLIRKGLTRQLSLETGINYTKRNFDLTISDDSLDFVDRSDFSYVIYEIPITLMVNVQLGEQSFLNSSFGLSVNFLPSDWDSFDSFFQHISVRRRWIIPSLLANLGYEYRTANKGYYYIGLSYHNPFSEITNAGVLYQTADELGRFSERERSTFQISGNYLTIDLRYFFHEDPERKRKKKKK